MQSRHRQSVPPKWVCRTLVAAGIYNLAWGGWVVADPGALFRWAGMELPRYPQIWQCVGMIVGVYGIGYWIAARNPWRHWPIIFVGLLGKVLGPLGFAMAVWQQALPLSFGATIITNDLIWWFPFAAILYQALRYHSDPSTDERTPRRELLMATMTSHRGRTIAELSRERPLMLVFLRHAGCTFCREALADLQQLRECIDRTGTELALVHMSSPLQASLVTAKYGLDDLHRFSDPECQLYEAFGLGRGTWRQLFGWRVIRRGLSAFWHGHGLGMLAGDGFRMPGVFRIERGRIVGSYIHQTAADRPDYLTLACDAESDKHLVRVS